MAQRGYRALVARAGMVALLGAVAAGCAGTKITSGGPFSAAVKTEEGALRYSLAKSVVTVEATVTRGASGKVSFDGDDFSVDTRLVRKDAKAVVSVETAVDDSQFFTLRIEHGSQADDRLSVEIAPNGLLRSVGATSSSQTLTTVKNVVTAAASVAAVIAAASLGRDPKKEAAALVCDKLASESGTPGRCPVAVTPVPAPVTAPPRPPVGPTKSGLPAPAPAQPAPSVTAQPAKSAPAATGCDRRTELSLGEMSMANLYFLARSSKHRRLWLERREAEARVDERTCRRMELERAAESAAPKELESVSAKLAMQLQLEAAARADLRQVSDELDRTLTDFQREQGIAGPTRTEVVRMTFELDEIPPPEVLRRALAPEPPSTTAGMAETDVRAALAPYTRMLQLFDRTGIALTLTPPPVMAKAPTAWKEDDPGSARTRIYYRPAYPAALTTYAMQRAADEQGGEQDLLRFFAVASDDVMHPKMPVLGFSFEPTIFSERSLSVAFDERGRLVAYEQTGRSSVVAATGALSESIQSARDEYATTLGRIAEIQDTKRRLEQNDVLTEIDRLRRQRELIDERLELSGARSNYDLVLEKKRLDAQLEATQARRALSDERSAAAVSEEVGQLRQKLDQLTRQVEEMQHRSSQTPQQPIAGPR